MEVTVLNIFEELRFILELITAEHMVNYCFAKRKSNYLVRAVIGCVLLCILAEMYFIVGQGVFATMSKFWIGTFNVLWYIFLTLCSVLYIKQCYYLTNVDAVLLCSLAYCMQHIEFVAINEVLARGIWSDLLSFVPLYICICVLSVSMLYSVLYRIFGPVLRRGDGNLYKDTSENMLFVGMLFLLVFLATFMSQSLFVRGEQAYNNVDYQGATVDFLICCLFLWGVYGILQTKNIHQEKEIVEQLLYERKRQYELSRENIQIINKKCHDLKHQLRALERVDDIERTNYIHELEESIEIYDAVVETGNEVVDTIISEKALICGKRHIRLSCIVDASHLDFMSTLDIYALLGNALDNAIENVSKYEDTDKRVISLTIKAVGNFLSIQTNNYYEGEIKFEDGLPVTTKKNKDFHGFGMKSMQHLTKKYGGSMVTSAKDNIFVLQILLPMPKEFLRLYAMERKGE